MVRNFMAVPEGTLFRPGRSTAQTLAGTYQHAFDDAAAAVPLPLSPGHAAFALFDPTRLVSPSPARVGAPSTVPTLLPATAARAVLSHWRTVGAMISSRGLSANSRSSIS